MHRRMLEQLGGFFCSTVVAVSVAACATPAAPTAAPRATTAIAPVTLTLWHTQTGTARATLDALANDFRKIYPTITVRVEAKANDGDLLRQGVAALAMNQPPDLIIANDRLVAAFARKNTLTNLDGFINDSKTGLTADERSDFFPGFLDAGRLGDQQDQLFALPFDERAVVLFYNIDLLKATNVNGSLRTWEQFNTAARVTTKGNTRGWAMLPSASVFYAFLFSHGGNVLDVAKNQVLFNDDAGVQTLQIISALSKGGSAYIATSAASVRDDFVQGKTALWFGATDDVPLIVDAITRASNPIQWGITNIPQDDPSHPMTAVLGANLAIFKTNSERERAAWLFARWLILPEQSARWSRATLTMPVRESALSLLAKDAPPLYQYLRTGFGDILPAGRAVPNVGNAEQIDAAMVDLWTSVANGTDPNTALKNTATRVNRLLGQIP